MNLKGLLIQLKRLTVEQAMSIFVLALLMPSSPVCANMCASLFNQNAQLKTILEKSIITSETDNPDSGRNTSTIVTFKNSNVRAKVKDPRDSDSIRNEIISYLISERTGLELVPVTTKRKIDGMTIIIQEFKEGYTLLAERIKSKDRPFKLRSDIFEYLVNNSDSNSGDIIYNPKTKKEAYVDSERTFEVSVLNNYEGRPVSYYEKLPVKSRPKIETFDLKMKDYLSDKKFLDRFALLDAKQVFSNLPRTTDEYQLLGIIEARWRMEKLQAQIIKLQNDNK